MPKKKKVEYITQAEFARRIGTSRQNVRYALNRETIKLSSNGLINYERQKKAYEENRNLSQVRDRPPRKKPKKTKKTKPKSNGVKDIKDIPSVNSMGNMPLDDYDSEYSGDEDDTGPKKGSYAYNQNRKVAAEADRHELKFALELGDVMATEVALLIAGDKMRSVKEAMLSMPSKTTGLIVADIKNKVEVWKDGELDLLSNSISNILKSSVEDVLAALSASKTSLPKDIEAYFENKR